MRRGAHRAGRAESLPTLHSPPRWFLLTVLSCCLVAAVSESVAQPPVVNVSVDSSADSTRLVLTHSRQVGYVIETSRSKVRVRYAEPVDVRPPNARFEDLILKRYRMRDDRTLSLDTGSRYDRYETFELRNPFRLVLDLKAAPRKASGQQRRRKRPEKTTIIVLDPGHGGVENGAIGPTGLREKDVTLTLARRLKRELERGNRSISVVLTRDEDRLVGLDERTAIANHNKADLFLSIHLNASPRARATGAETYYLSTDATDDEARILAALENQAGSQADTRPDQRVEQGSLDLVLWDLAQNQYLAESSALAEAIQRHLNRLTGTRSRGVRQAPFRVLMGATMPAVLVEVGFISNAEEEELFQTPSYRARVVNAMAAAVEEFLLDLERYSVPGSVGGGTVRP
jgi:N-acetylmuramoyl-L-alanine amidase